jgi:predicted MFS family arabinose efflux permease
MSIKSIANFELQSISENLMDNNQREISPSMKSILFSKEFITVFLLTTSKTFTNFLYGENITEIGIALVKDTDFVTKITIFAGIFNFLIRYNMGNLYNFFGMKGLYLVNFLLEITQSLILYFFGTYKFGFIIFVIFWRSSSGCQFLFNFLIF